MGATNGMGVVIAERTGEVEMGAEGLVPLTS